jgi:hypothetical protein
MSGSGTTSFLARNAAITLALYCEMDQYMETINCESNTASAEPRQNEHDPGHTTGGVQAITAAQNPKSTTIKTAIERFMESGCQGQK